VPSAAILAQLLACGERFLAPRGLARVLVRVAPLRELDHAGSRQTIVKTDPVAVEKDAQRHDSESRAEKEDQTPHQSATEAHVATILANDTDSSDPHARCLPSAQP
jgi:hypothetical protein